MAAVAEIVKRIAVIDDEPDELVLREVELRGFGFDVVPINQKLSSVDALVEIVRASADACICDHALQPLGFASFYGAEPVAKLNESGLPAILVTQFLMDQDVSMRRWRQHVPVVLSKDDAEASRLVEGLDICFRELKGEIPPHRRLARTLLEVVRLAQEDNQAVVDVSIASWHPARAVRLPLELLPIELQALDVGTRLIASVNTGATEESDIFFADFEPAPDPLPESRFG